MANPVAERTQLMNDSTMAHTSFWHRLHPARPPVPWDYVVAMMGVSAAWLLRKAADPYLHDFQPFSIFYVVVAFVAWACGWRAAVLAQIAGYLAGDWSFSPPRGSLRPTDASQVLELALYFVVTTTVICLIHALRKANQATADALRIATEKEKALEADIAMRRELEMALARRGEELEELVRERTARLSETIGELESFSYSLTHDMRAPLRAMQSFTGILEADFAVAASAESKDLLRRIRVAASRMDELITESLDYTKLLREEMTLKEVDLGRLLHEMAESYPNLQAPAAEVRIDFSELWVIGNEAALIQCFSNLLGNAVKFVAPGITPRVRVWAERMESCPAQPPGRDKRTVRIWIEDNGIGIPAEAHQKIFGMFQRMHRQDEYPGTGIGLTMVRKAVERMGGQVGLESELGKGSRFWVTLVQQEIR